MKFIRFADSDLVEHYGVIEGNDIYEIKESPFESVSRTNVRFSVDNIKFLPPCKPSKIVAVGLNYKDHAEEMGKPIPDEPILFIKPSTSVIAHEDNIIYPDHMSSRVDYEGELGVVIGKEAKNIDSKNTENYIFGYTCINDITARDLQAKDGQFTRAKGFDTFAPLGPYIETEIDPSNLELKTYLNGKTKQHSRTSNLIFSVPRLLSFISQVMTLYPGDVISTGTPSGIAPMKPGDKVEVEIQGIGLLRNYLVVNKN